jgi:hypothetical protein
MTDFPRDLVARTYHLWHEAFDSGDSRRTYAVLRDAFGGYSSFSWPWLKQSFDWIEREIAPALGWPYLWRTPIRKELRLPARTLKLLDGELHGMAYWSRNRANAAQLRRRRTTSRAILISGHGCPVEDAIARRFIDRFAAGDGTAWPPYFPGDRTGVVVDVFGDLTMPSEISRCSLISVEPFWPVPPTMPFPSL